MDLLKAIIVVSEKAANVARICRQDEHLFQLLIQEKQPDEANPRFIADFKTLADVLIQEMVKHDIGKQFPALENYIRGEENNTFSNKLGETICVQVKSAESETCQLLAKVLNDDKRAAELLAAEVHRNVDVGDVNTARLPADHDLTLDLAELGVWIDPIDCTAEYINGAENGSDEGICTSGLQCVTVLIGVYNKLNNLPIIGIVNQPFVKKITCTWQGKCMWGICHDSSNYSSFSELLYARNNVISVSGSESQMVKDKLVANQFELVEASGAGYKILTVISGLADAYILSKSSTFKWDTCAPHAILRSLGGDVVIYEEAIVNRNLVSVKYPWINEKSNNCNFGGIIVFRSQQVLDEIVDILK